MPSTTKNISEPARDEAETASARSAFDSGDSDIAELVGQCDTHGCNRCRLGAQQVVPKEATLLNELVNAIGSPQFDPGAWVSAAMVLGELGLDFSNLLEHSDRRMRLAAAMLRSASPDPRSVTELASALSQPEWLEAEFPNGAAHLDMHLRFHMLTVLQLARLTGDRKHTGLLDLFRRR